MNTFFKLFVVKKSQDTCVLLYGYGLADYNETRVWSSGVIDKKLKLYKLTCVMNEENTLKFQKALLNKDKIYITKDFCINGGFTLRPNTIMYSKKNINSDCKNILKSLASVKEYWNLDKIDIFNQLQEIYKNKEAKKQRKQIHDVIDKISKEISISLFDDSSERLGNIEIYIKNEFSDKVEITSKRIEDKITKKVSCKGIKIKKIKDIKLDLIVNCELENGGRCLLNEIKEMKKSENSIEFDANENISKVSVKIWNKKDGILVYDFQSNLVRDLKFSIEILSNTKYLLNDEWTSKLEKTFGGSKEKMEKLDVVKMKDYKNKPIISNIDIEFDDPWLEAGILSKRLIRPFIYEDEKGAFCKKVGEGECEIDSFCKISEYLNSTNVKRVIILDPYFSIKAMTKFLTRVNNSELELEVITSLVNIDPDKEAIDAHNKNYLNEIKEFLKKNSPIIHKHLKIINITQNENVAFHDRYLLRLLDDGTIDGYLLSNSLNSAGQNYSFVIAQMDKEVTYSVLEYVGEIKNKEIQNNKGKSERLKIEVLWDSSNAEKKENNIQLKDWEQYMKSNYGNGELFELEEIFYEEWYVDYKKAKENILKLSWYLYHSKKEKVMISKLKEFINTDEQVNKLLSICEEVALELEKEEESYEKSNLMNNRNLEIYTIRQALDKENQKDSMIYSRYLIDNCSSFMYSYIVNGYLLSLYNIVYEFSHKELINIMENAHSPKAMSLLIENIVSDDELDIEVYERLLQSDIKWIRELAYFYFDNNIINKIKNEKNVTYKLDVNYYDEVAMYQYASCIEEISFEINRVRNTINDKKIYISKLKEAFKFYIEEEGNIIDRCSNFDEEFLFRLLNGPNIKINYENYYLLLQQLSNKKFRDIVLNKMMSLFSEKWEKEEILFSMYDDCYITYYAAYAYLEYFNNDIENIYKELKINNKSLYIATEAGKYDMNYTEWENAVIKVLWQMLFLKYCKQILKEKNISSEESHAKISEKFTELSNINKECTKLKGYDRLVNIIFSEEI
ncbi:VPA1262 family protein [Clostridium perfringens]|nr:VPA1262 family protein [Clostridium perfringens]MDM0723147.1 VPA1262 family protein [Clostridium perfringens]